MDTFNHYADVGSSVEPTFKVLRYQFGDGYEQRLRNGLNNKLRTWSVSFKVGTEEANTIFTFLKDREGVYPFIWTASPEQEDVVVVCDNVSKTYNSVGWYTVSATFREVPEK